MCECSKRHKAAASRSTERLSNGSSLSKAILPRNSRKLSAPPGATRAVLYRGRSTSAINDKMSEFSADEKIETPAMNGEVVLVESARKQSGPGRITSPQTGFAGGTPPSGSVAATRSSVTRRAQMTASEISNQKHSISERELKSNFSEVKSAMSEMKATFESAGTSLGGADMTVATSAPSGSAMAKLANSGLLNRGGSESYDVIPSLDGDPVSQINGSAKNMKFQQTTSSSSQMKFMSNSGYSSEEAIANSSQKKTFQSDGVLYEEKSEEAAMKARIEMDGIKAEKAAAMKQEQKSLHTGDVAAQETRSSSSASMKVHSDNFTAEKMSTTFKNERNMVTTTGSYNQQSRTSATTKKQLKIEVQSIKTETKTETTATTQMTVDELSLPPLDDLEKLGSDSNPNDIESAILKYTCAMSTCVDQLKSVQQEHMPKVLNHVHEMIRKAWLVPNFGHDLVDNLCNVLRMNGGLDILLANCTSNKDDLKLSSAKVLQQCLTQENRGYVVENALQKVVQVACNYAKEGKNPDHTRVGTGILEHLFKHNEMTCTDVVKLGGLDAVIRECRKTDVETLRHCAGALANLSLYGGTENQEHMIKRKVPYWLFPLAFHTDDNIKYYACLAIVVLVANKEIEGQVRKSEALNLVEPFVSSHDPIAFATTCATHRHGQNKSWLQRLVPVLTSEKEEARNLAAFHFCMEAGIKKKQGQEGVFREIGAIDPLKRVASSPSPIASKYAAQALRIIGEEVPHKLTPQVPLWSVEDVREWVKQVGFSEYCENFEKCQVDGDLLLQLTDENLRDDIGIKKAILRKKFLRELNAMKQKADYSSCDKNKVSEFLKSVDESYLMYTYNLLIAGVSKPHLRNLTEEQLQECGITSSIHRQRILEYVREDEGDCFIIDDKPVDVFISYRRSNGSQLASLLKVHLQLRGLSVFIDVDRLEAGKFDNNLLMSIRKAKTFILVLTPGSLDRCIDDKDGKDWVHREIVEALASDCNIIPVFDNFTMPDPAKLPDDMKQIVTFNGVTWIHEYQDACVEKIDKFIRREGDGSVIMNRYDPHMGLSTPSQSLLNLTPDPRLVKPSYARTASSDSSKMTPCSNDILSLGNGQVRE